MTRPEWEVINRKIGNRTACNLVNTETRYQVASFDDWTLAEAIASILNTVGPAVLDAEMKAAGSREPF